MALSVVAVHSVKRREGRGSAQNLHCKKSDSSGVDLCKTLAGTIHRGMAPVPGSEGITLENFRDFTLTILNSGALWDCKSGTYSISKIQKYGLSDFKISKIYYIQARLWQCIFNQVAAEYMIYI